MLSNNFGSCVEIALNLHFPFSVWIDPYIGNQKTRRNENFCQRTKFNYKLQTLRLVICGFSPY